MEFGFVQSKADYSLFTKLTKSGDFDALLVHMDDIIIIASSSVALSDEVKNYLKTKFKLFKIS